MNPTWLRPSIYPMELSFFRAARYLVRPNGGGIDYAPVQARRVLKLAQHLRSYFGLAPVPKPCVHRALGT